MEKMGLNNGETATTPERAERMGEIMESSRADRASLLGKIFNRQTADVAGNLIPGVDAIKLAAEAAVGKTFAGKELSGREQVDYAMIAGVLTVAYTLYFSGMHRESVKVRSLATAIATVELGPDIVRQVAAAAQGNFPRIASFLEKTGMFFEGARKNLLDDSAIAMRELVMGSSEIMSLGLHEE
jgi:hypothetical protein